MNFKKYLFAFKSFVFLLAVLLGFLFFNNKTTQAAELANSISNPPADVECHWVDSAHIVCTYKAGLFIDTASLGERRNETDCGGGLKLPNGYTCIDFWFAALDSKRAGYVIFKGEEKDKATSDRHLSFTTNDPSAAAWYNRDESQNIQLDWAPPPEGTPTNVTIDKVSLAAKSAGEGYCSIFVTYNCSKGPGNTSPNNTSSGVDTSLFRQQVMILAAKEIALSDCNDKAPVGFLFCPLLNGINGAISTLIGGNDIVEGQRKGLLVSFLQLPPLLGQGSTFGQVVGNVVTIANIIYVFVFLVLIFSSTLPFGLDNYTIKKTLPKFIAAVILTQFSVVICGVIVDVFNLLGNAIPNVIYFLASGSAAAGNSGKEIVTRLGNNVTSDLIGGAVAIGSVIGYILIFIFAFIALIAGLIAIVYMIIRYFILYMLVLVAPLAFVAWVIPGTEKFFTNWWKNFIRLNAMYVTIMALLSGSLLLSSLLQALFPKNDPASLIPSLIPLVALMLVPKTLKWTTQGMAALGSLGAVAGKMNAGVKPAKTMTQKGMKAGKEGVQNKAAESRFGQTRLGGAIAGGGIGSVLGTRGAQRKVAARQAKLRSERSTEAAIQFARYKGGAMTADQLVSSAGGSRAAQFALMAQAAQAGDTDVLKSLRSKMGDDSWKEGVAANYPTFDKVAPYRALSGGGEPFGADFKKEIRDLTYSSMTDLGGGMQKEIANDHFEEVNKQIFIDAHSDTTNRNKLSLDLREKAYAWAYDNSSSPIAQGILQRIDSSGNWIDNTGSSGNQPPAAGGGGGGTQPSPQNPTGGNSTTGTPGNPTVNIGP
jgi:hypothetical protein